MPTTSSRACGCPCMGSRTPYVSGPLLGRFTRRSPLTARSIPLSGVPKSAAAERGSECAFLNILLYIRKYRLMMTIAYILQANRFSDALFSTGYRTYQALIAYADVQNRLNPFEIVQNRSLAPSGACGQLPATSADRVRMRRGGRCPLGADRSWRPAPSRRERGRRCPGRGCGTLRTGSRKPRLRSARRNRSISGGP